jgi:hypothetical protein
METVETHIKLRLELKLAKMYDFWVALHPFSENNQNSGI